jgi:hypothetical protein
VAQGLQQAGLELGEEAPALGGVAGPLHLAAQGEPLLRPGLQAFVGSAVAVASGLICLVGLSRCFGGLPGVEPGLDVALEDFGQVVVAVELVFVGDAGEGLNGVQYGHGQAPAGLGLQTAAST